MKKLKVMAVLQKLEELTPPIIWKSLIKIKRQVQSKEINYDFANLILDNAIEYSEYIGGDVDSFDRKLTDIIKYSDNQCNSIIQDILTAFMPNYTQNLYEYYKEQQYLIFYRFLTYPFSSNVSSYAKLYEKGIEFLKKVDILDYGSGIPYGLIYFLLNNKKKVSSITLIDLDLVHVNFTEYIIRKIAPDIKFDIFRLNDTNLFPQLKENYNFFFGKDIFEHLSNPLENLNKLMVHSTSKCICYFDFRNHGEKIYQHVSPNIDYLSKEMSKIGFINNGEILTLTEFIRNA